MLLKDIIGQEAVKREMCRSVQEGRIPHAQLLSGPAGVGKLALALAYVQYIACKHRTATDACGVCPTCLQYSKLQHPDLHFAFPIVKVDKGAEVCDDYMSAFREMVLSNPYCDADDWAQKMGEEKKQNLIYEKESSEIQRKLSLKAFGDGYKVMIIWQPEKMHIACANKLLKLLEEPPEMTLFLFVSEHPDQLLPTIISRLRPLPVPRLTEEQIVQKLTADGHGTMAADAARLAKGSYREALRILDEKDSSKQMFVQFQELMRNAWLVVCARTTTRCRTSISGHSRWQRTAHVHSSARSCSSPNGSCERTSYTTTASLRSTTRQATNRRSPSSSRRSSMSAMWKS